MFFIWFATGFYRFLSSFMTIFGFSKSFGVVCLMFFVGFFGLSRVPLLPSEFR